MKKLGLLSAVATLLVIILLVATGCSCDSDPGTGSAADADGANGVTAGGDGADQGEKPTLTPEQTEFSRFFDSFQLMPPDPWLQAGHLSVDTWTTNLFYSISTTGVQLDPKDSLEADIAAVFGGIFDMDQQATKAAMGNTLYECGENVDGMLTVCPGNAGAVSAGEFVVLAMLQEGEIPLEDPDRYFTYAAVFDSDGDTSNNFEFMPPYDWDLYQGTDRWYELIWDPDFGWQVIVRQLGENQEAASSARVVIDGRLVVFFIPVSEFAVSRPGYRLTAFVHDGTYSPEASAGDVNGENPTLPLTPLPEDAIVVESVIEE